MKLTQTFIALLVFLPLLRNPLFAEHSLSAGLEQNHGEYVWENDAHGNRSEPFGSRLRYELNYTNYSLGWIWKKDSFDLTTNLLFTPGYVKTGRATDEDFNYPYHEKEHFSGFDTSTWRYNDSAYATDTSENWAISIADSYVKNLELRSFFTYYLQEPQKGFHIGGGFRYREMDVSFCKTYSFNLIYPPSVTYFPSGIDLMNYMYEIDFRSGYKIDFGSGIFLDSGVGVGYAKDYYHVFTKGRYFFVQGENTAAPVSLFSRLKYESPYNVDLSLHFEAYRFFSWAEHSMTTSGFFPGDISLYLRTQGKDNFLPYINTKEARIGFSASVRIPDGALSRSSKEESEN